MLIAVLYFLLGPILSVGPELLGLPPSRFPALAAGVVTLGVLVFLPSKRTLSWPVIWVAAAFSAVMAVGAFRAPVDMMPFRTQVGTAFGPPLTFTVAVLAFQRANHRSHLTTALLFSIPIFVALMLALSFVRSVPEIGGSENGTLALIGLHVARLSALPSLVTPNVIGLLAGAGAVTSAFLALENGRWRWLAAALCLVNGAVLVMAETRSAIIIALAATAAALLLPRRIMFKTVAVLVVATVVSAPALNWAFQALSGSSLGDFATRQQGAGRGLGVGTGRGFIWDAALSELSRPTIDHAWGFGLFSQQTTGIMNQFSEMFKGFTDLPSFHNAELQYVFDVGYVGFGLYLVAICVLARRVSSIHVGEVSGRCALAVIAYVLASGWTETAGSPYHTQVYLLLFGFLGLAATEEYVSQSTKQPGIRRRFSFRRA